MKQYKIFTDLKMSHIANQIVTICEYLANFKPALVPVAENQETDLSDTSNSDNE